jgi:oligopeptide/dipeptide ABC transporter ATP-binding protein
MTDDVLLELRGVSVDFAVTRKVRLRALDDVSITVHRGRTLGIVGESGCGKSTLGRVSLGLVRPTAGEVRYAGTRIDRLDTRGFRPFRRRLQMVFQDPTTSLDPRMQIGASVAEPLAQFERQLGPGELRARAAAWLERVGLPATLQGRYPHELSGGQCQRAAVARALILAPELLVCDEPVSSLDVSVQAQIVRLLADLRAETGMSLVFISHNLAVVRLLSERVLVLYLGRVMEHAPREALFSAPLHPYTRALLESVPVADPAVERTRVRPALGSELPSPLDPPTGCVFRTRCPLAIDRCAAERPALERAADGHWVACHRWRDAGGVPPNDQAGSRYQG